MDPHDADRHATFRKLAASQKLSEDTINKLIKEECMDIETISLITKTATRQLSLTIGQGLQLMHWAQKLRQQQITTRDTSTETIEDDADKNETDSSGSSHTHSTQPQTDPVIEPDTNGQTCASSDMYELNDGPNSSDGINKPQATEAMNVSGACFASRHKFTLPSRSMQAHQILPEQRTQVVKPNYGKSEQGKPTAPKHQPDASSRRHLYEEKRTQVMEPNRRQSEHGTVTTLSKHLQDRTSSRNFSEEQRRKVVGSISRQPEHGTETTPPKHQQDKASRRLFSEELRTQVMESNRRLSEHHMYASSSRHLYEEKITQVVASYSLSEQVKAATTSIPQQDTVTGRNVSEEQITPVVKPNRGPSEQGNKQTRHARYCLSNLIPPPTKLDGFTTSYLSVCLLAGVFNNVYRPVRTSQALSVRPFLYKVLPEPLLDIYQYPKESYTDKYCKILNLLSLYPLV